MHFGKKYNLEKIVNVKTKYKDFLFIKKKIKHVISEKYDQTI